MSWTVEGALEEVVDVIAAGAAPLEVNPQTRNSLKALFEGDFEAQLQVGAQWPMDKERVLPLARRIGKRAMLMTLDRFALTPSVDQEEVTHVDSEVAVRAAYFVCKTYQIAGRKAGPYCPRISVPSGMEEHTALESLLNRIRQSGFEV